MMMLVPVMMTVLVLPTSNHWTSAKKTYFLSLFCSFTSTDNNNKCWMNDKERLGCCCVVVVVFECPLVSRGAVVFSLLLLGAGGRRGIDRTRHAVSQRKAVGTPS